MSIAPASASETCCAAGADLARREAGDDDERDRPEPLVEELLARDVPACASAG